MCETSLTIKETKTVFLVGVSRHNITISPYSISNGAVTMLGQCRSCFNLLKFNELACFIRSLKILGVQLKGARGKERKKERKRKKDNCQ